jgi:hypothetical protein
MVTTRRRGRPPIAEQYVKLVRATFRLDPEVLKTLKRSARRAKLSQSGYVELALKDRFQKDRLKKDSIE